MDQNTGGELHCILIEKWIKIQGGLSPEKMDLSLWDDVCGIIN